MGLIWGNTIKGLPINVKIKLSCIMKDCDTCIDLSDPKFDDLCGREKCILEFVLKKYFSITCLC